MFVRLPLPRPDSRKGTEISQEIGTVLSSLPGGFNRSEGTKKFSSPWLVVACAVPQTLVISKVLSLLSGAQFAWGEVCVKRAGEGFQLSHAADASAEPTTLKEISGKDLRQRAMYTEEGQFRPLRSAPSLARGWYADLKDAAELELALNEIYPGSLSDWYAAQLSNPPVTGYREFTNRQTGMYRITQLLDDSSAANVIRAGCHRRLCVKRRLWTVTGLAPDSPETKSFIPCLEPCAVLLEFARKATRIEQEEKMTVQLTESEAATVGAALRAAMENPQLLGREGDTANPLNPRRVQLLLEKYGPLFEAADHPEEK
jgi:hypothetical protein